MSHIQIYARRLLAGVEVLQRRLVPPNNGALLVHQGFCPNDLRGGHCLSDFLFSIGHPASFLLLVLSICCFRIVRPWCCLLCVLFCAIALCVHE